ncbi:hypothetical protein VVT58_10260 [Sphingobium sp. SJ10-10]|nr:hypothetical protein [Sphingobium sp. SJ10-10]
MKKAADFHDPSPEKGRLSGYRLAQVARQCTELCGKIGWVTRTNQSDCRTGLHQFAGCRAIARD